LIILQIFLLRAEKSSKYKRYAKHSENGGGNTIIKRKRAKIN